MVPAVLKGTVWGEAVFALIVVVLSYVLSKVVVFIFQRVLKRLTRHTKTTLDDLLVEALERPIALLVIAMGVYVALTATTLLDKGQRIINRGALIAVIFVIAYGLQRAMAALVTWYSTEIAPKTESDLDDRLIPIVRKVLIAIIYGLAGLIMLDALKVPISPLLASLGIGGLAVALALQPTLSSFMASAYLASDGGIKIGDHIQMEGGPGGSVRDIGWRTTKLHTPQGNLVLVPNSKLVDSIVTNYHVPTPEIIVTVNCGVGYSSDLERVRMVALEVAREVLAAVPGAVQDFQPVVRFYEFGDSNINFRTLLKAKEYAAQFDLIDRYISALHRRFGEEGIDISFPVRKVLFEAGNTPQAMGQGTDGGVGRPRT